MDVKKTIIGLLFVNLFQFNYAYATSATLDTKTNNTAATFDTKINKALLAHYEKYKDVEFFSGASLSVYIPHETIKNYYIGRVSHEPDSLNVTADTLFQIGSITKSFTAAVILQFEREGKIHLEDSIGNWLPNYRKWGTVTIDKLLNMTSGIPNYSDTPLWNAAEHNDPTRTWANSELIDFVYPVNDLIPPLRSGYYYSNTNYILADQIAEKATEMSFKEELTTRTIKAANLTNTFYPVPTIDDAILPRVAHGYSYNPYDNPELLGKDISNFNLSWAAAAGGIISNSEDVIKWVKALFVDGKILDEKQKKKLEQLISLRSGKAIKETSKEDTSAFGLGIAQRYDSNLGRVWFYEGETLGFRSLYVYKPCNGVIISTIFNSATNNENDHAHELLERIYQLILENKSSLRC